MSTKQPLAQGPLPLIAPKIRAPVHAFATLSSSAGPSSKRCSASPDSFFPVGMSLKRSIDPSSDRSDSIFHQNRRRQPPTRPIVATDLNWQSILGSNMTLSLPPISHHANISNHVDPLGCMPCQFLKHLKTCHTEEDGRCPYYRFASHFDAFLQGWISNQIHQVIYARDAVGDSVYGVCGRCYVEKCTCHPKHPLFVHEDHQCPSLAHQDGRHLWFVRAIYVVLSSGQARDSIARLVSNESSLPPLDATNLQGIHEWGAWACGIWGDGMSRASVCISIWLSAYP
jgi:hypothetical protein